MKEDMEAIEKNLTWDLVKPPEKYMPIGVKWIYKVKTNSTGEITRHKACLVAKGSSQKKGKDYDEVFSPVARAESIRILIALAAQLKWNLHHLDVKSAFLNGEIEEEIYCWDLKLEKLSKSLSKIMIAAEGVESKHSTSWKHQDWMISSSILGDPII